MYEQNETDNEKNDIDILRDRYIKNRIKYINNYKIKNKTSEYLI